jgi:transcriptional regulator with XRE-family HTH domain
MLRERAGLTHEDIARALGVSRPAVTRWEGGRRTPQGGHLEGYLRLLGRLAGS